MQILLGEYKTRPEQTEYSGHCYLSKSDNKFKTACKSVISRYLNHTSIKCVQNALLQLLSDENFAILKVQYI